jgi:hypothetical protein
MIADPPEPWLSRDLLLDQLRWIYRPGPWQLLAGESSSGPRLYQDTERLGLALIELLERLLEPWFAGTAELDLDGIRRLRDLVQEPPARRRRIPRLKG